MSAQVAPAPHITMSHHAIPPPSDATFLDVVLDNSCCAADDASGAGSASRRGSPLVEGFPPQHPQRSFSRSLSAGSTSALINKQRRRESSRSPHKEREGPEPILPHLRFNPLPASSGSSIECTSLQEFFALFLADDAPHSFWLFHEANGDDIVRVTPWKTVEDDTGNPDDSNINSCNMTRRTIEFKTKITPGSSSNPLSQSEHINTNPAAAVIPLMVIITQTLTKHSLKRWTLQCDFAFDFISQSKLGTGLGSGLSQFLVSNVIKGSNVHVAVMLSECDDTGGTGPMPTNSQRASSRPRLRGGDRGSDHSVKSMPDPRCTLAPCQEEPLPSGLLAFLSHPLLMPPDLCGIGDCGAKVCGKGESNEGKHSLNSSLEEDEPSEVGASLLSAIKNKNAPIIDGNEYSMDTSLVKRPFMCGRNHFESLSKPFSGSYGMKTSKREVKREAGQEDVLSYNSSNSHLKAKRVPSFELSRAPSTSSMRQIILSKKSSSPSKISSPGRRSPEPPSPQGLSMRIEMELSNTNSSGPSSTASSISSSLSRSASIMTIDDKVRRGLKKRVARSWITWAESWCMRLWEEESSEISSTGKRRNIPHGGKIPTGKRNVRPIVRRIGDPVKPDSPASPENVWEPLAPRRNRSGRSEKWMSLEKEDEMGVEVACTMFAPKPRKKSPLLAMVPSKENGRLKHESGKGKRRLLKKSLSSASLKHSI